MSRFAHAKGERRFHAKFAHARFIVIPYRGPRRAPFEALAAAAAVTIDGSEKARCRADMSKSRLQTVCRFK